MNTPALPEADFEPMLREQIAALFTKGFGMVAMENGEMLGYLAYWKSIEGFFGRCKGAYSPLHGSAYAGKDRGKLCSLLFEKVSRELTKLGHTSYAMSCYADDETVGKSLALNGFGIRCSDSIRMLDVPVAYPELAQVSCKAVPPDQLDALLPLHQELTRHLLDAPVYFPSAPEQALRSFRNPERRTFAAYRDGKPVGMMQVADEGENFITEADGMKNICGMIFAPSERGTGAAAKLLGYIVDTLKHEGNCRLGVDCETLNPTALRFWGKYFTPYTYSYHRRLDERVLR